MLVSFNKAPGPLQQQSWLYASFYTVSTVLVGLIHETWMLYLYAL